MGAFPKRPGAMSRSPKRRHVHSELPYCRWKYERLRISNLPLASRPKVVFKACLTSDGLIYVEQQRLAQLAQKHNLPLIGYTREMASWPGMLMIYGASNVALFK